MAIINRVARLFRADVHAVLDRIEEPELLLRQSIRDMDDEVQILERRIAGSASDLAVLDRRADGIRRSVEKVPEELDLCFDSGNEELAKKLLRRRLEAERRLRHVDEQRAATESRAGELRSRLAEQQAALESLRQKAEILCRDRTSPAAEGATFDDARIGDDEVEIAYLRELATRRPS